MNNIDAIVVPQLLDPQRCELLFMGLQLQSLTTGRSDAQCERSLAFYGHPPCEALLLILQKEIEHHVGLELLPTYSYSRIYRPGEVLEPHKDRPACEISCTLHVGRLGVDAAWPIHMGRTKLLQNIGDAVIYKGCDVLHWRDEWEAPPKAMYGQVFLHYVDANGPHAEWQFDGRPSLGVPK